nr:protein NYNRIN-like [Setaria viridis]
MVLQGKEWKVKVDAQPAPTPVKPTEPLVRPVEMPVPPVEPVRPAVEPVQSAKPEMSPSFASSTPVACENELTSVPKTEDDEQLVDYSSSPECMNLEINVVHMSADGGSDEKLIKTNMTVSGVGGGEPMGAKGVVSMELTIGSKTLATAFFIAETQGWGLDFVGKIHPPSSKRHYFVIVATDYFIKWIEAISLKNMTHRGVIEFVKEHIVHRFGIPQTLTTDEGTSFISKEVREFVESYGIKFLNVSPYYAQANGQAESSNKNLIKLIKKKIEDSPRICHEVLPEALWAQRISRYGASKVTSFELVYGQEAVLPVEVNLGTYRLAKQNDLDFDTYHALMVDNIDEVTDKRLEALKEIAKDKIQVARAYNKKVKAKSFQVNDLVWKIILPIGTKSNKFGKSPLSWEGPYKIVKALFGNSYMVETLQGQQLPRALNGRYLKKYYPSVWKDA